MTTITKRMTREYLPVLVISFAIAAFFAQTEVSSAQELSLAGKLCAAYEGIETITCQIRKTTETGGNSVTMLSRVFYKKQDHVHVENVAPSKRTIIADGKKLFYHDENAPRGFSKAISELEPSWLTHLKNVPGTPMEHLLKLRNLAETAIPSTQEFPVRRAYQTEKVYVVLSCDSKGRPAQIDFFQSPDMTRKTAQINYSDFKEISENCWIPCLHKTVLSAPGGEQIIETRRIDNVVANKPIADSMFSADLFFKDIEFVSDFKETFNK